MEKNTSKTIKMIIPRYLVNTGEVINDVRTVWPGYLSLASAFFHVSPLQTLGEPAALFAQSCPPTI